MKGCGVVSRSPNAASCAASSKTENETLFAVCCKESSIDMRVSEEEEEEEEEARRRDSSRSACCC